MASLPRILAPLAAVALARLGGAADLAVHAVAAGRAISVESREAWIDGGFGRLSEGRRPDAFEWLARGEAQIGIEWTPSAVFLVRAHATARTEPDAAGGARAGLTEAFLQYRPELRPDLALRFRGGLMFLPTSRENVDPLWQSPYTLTLSALNTWIGEELRPVGLDVAAATRRGGRLALRARGPGLRGERHRRCAFGLARLGDGNAALGRGRDASAAATAQLRSRSSLRRSAAAGTQPIDELDDRLGWHVRGRWSRAGTGLVQLAWTDTRGDRGLHEGQYAWATRFASLAAEAELGRFRLVAEGLAGETGMGIPDGPARRSPDPRRLRASHLGGPRAAVHGPLRPLPQPRPRRCRRAQPGVGLGRSRLPPSTHRARGCASASSTSTCTGDRPAAAFAGTGLDAGARRGQAELRFRF